MTQEVLTGHPFWVSRPYGPFSTMLLKYNLTVPVWHPPLVKSNPQSLPWELRLASPCFAPLSRYVTAFLLPEMGGWHPWLRHEFEQALGVGDEQGSLECSSPWGHKDSDMTERLNWTEFSQNPSVPFTIICSMFWSVQPTSVIAYVYILSISNFFDWRVNMQSHTPDILISPCGILLFIILEGSSLPSIPCPCRDEERSHMWYRNFLISLSKLGDNSKMGENYLKRLYLNKKIRGQFL